MHGVLREVAHFLGDDCSYMLSVGAKSRALGAG